MLDKELSRWQGVGRALIQELFQGREAMSVRDEVLLSRTHKGAIYHLTLVAVNTTNFFQISDDSFIYIYIYKYY